MNYLKHFNILGLEGRQLPCIPGSGVPTTATKGAYGDLYIDEDTGEIYKCLGVSSRLGLYIWEKLTHCHDIINPDTALDSGVYNCTNNREHYTLLTGNRIQIVDSVYGTYSYVKQVKITDDGVIYARKILMTAAVTLDNPAADITSIGDWEEVYATKIDYVDMTSSGNALTFNFMEHYNHELRCTNGEFLYFIFIFSDGEYEKDYHAGLSFDTGEEAPTITYTNSGILNWVGTDCSLVEGLSLFIPSPNMHYDIVFYFNGKQFIGLVNGFTPATVNNGGA